MKIWRALGPVDGPPVTVRELASAAGFSPSTVRSGYLRHWAHAGFVSLGHDRDGPTARKVRMSLHGYPVIAKDCGGSYVYVSDEGAGCYHTISYRRDGPPVIDRRAKRPSKTDRFAAV